MRRRRNPAAVILLFPLLLVVSCEEAVDTSAPSPCFGLTVTDGPGLCADDSTYTLDASCSRDDETVPDLLEVRWDLNNDGDWDTPYDFEKTYVDVSPPSGTWTVRCQVRDGDGRSAVAAHSFSVGPYSIGPDVVAERVLFRKEGAGYVTVAQPGDALYVEIPHRCVGDFDLLQTTVFLDGEVWFDGATGCAGTGGACHVMGIAWTPSDADTFTFVVSLDPENLIAETEEGNNTASGSIVIAP